MHEWLHKNRIKKKKISVRLALVRSIFRKELAKLYFKHGLSAPGCSHSLRTQGTLYALPSYVPGVPFMPSKS